MTRKEKRSIASQVVSPMDVYHSALKRGEMEKDDEQALTVKCLQGLFEQVLNKNFAKRKGMLSRMLQSKEDVPDVRGLYLWGGVGRGKTCLMDMFYQCLPGERKMRMHFHRFMSLVHKRLRELEGQKNPLELIGRLLAKDVDVLCFDEFFVNDIGDAMLLSGLMKGLFESGLVLVATSNIPPRKLYEDGLQREPFLPAIKLIEKYCRVVNVDGDKDFRLRTLEQAALYFYPLDADSQRSLGECFDRIAGNQELIVDSEIVILSRKIKILKAVEGVIWFDFSELCSSPRSASDYVELACENHTVLVSGVPVLNKKQDNDARRFIALVDEFYDHNVKLILSAETVMSELYIGKDLAFPFRRTLSRLQEMQSHDYLAKEHMP